MATSIVQFRIDDNLKAQATEIFEELGIDLSTALRIFLMQSVDVRGFPFDLTPSENELTIASDDEVLKISKRLIEKNKQAYEKLAK